MTRSTPGIAFAGLSARATVEICCPTLPLAIYREISCHLRQCPGIEVDILPQSKAQFDYGDSQVGGLRLQRQSDAGTAWEQVEAILGYYGTRYGDWELIGESH